MLKMVNGSTPSGPIGSVLATFKADFGKHFGKFKHQCDVHVLTVTRCTAKCGGSCGKAVLSDRRETTPCPDGCSPQVGLIGIVALIIVIRMVTTLTLNGENGVTRAKPVSPCAIAL